MPAKAYSDMLVEVFRQLDRTPEMLERVFDCFPDVLYYIKDAQARYLSVNQTLITRSGLLRDDVIGKTADQLFPVTGASTNAQDLNIIETRSPIVDRLPLYSAGMGHRYWCLTSKLPLLTQSAQALELTTISHHLL